MRLTRNSKGQFESKHTIREASPDKSENETPKRKLLKRELEAEALRRLEESAVTVKDFEDITLWWDRLDSNRERKERYHEIGRGDNMPLCSGVSHTSVYTTNSALASQLNNGNFIDAIYTSPSEIQELVSDKYLFDILSKLKPDKKELLHLKYIQGYSNSEIARIRGQTERNIRARLEVLLKNIRKSVYEYLTSDEAKNHSFTLKEKTFINEYNLACPPPQ